MDTTLETLVIVACAFACSLSVPRPGPARTVTDQEVMALAGTQAVAGLVADCRVPAAVGRLLPGCSPDPPDHQQFNHRLRRPTPQITTVQLVVAKLVADGNLHLVVGTLPGAADYAGFPPRNEFAGHAAYGWCAAKTCRC